MTQARLLILEVTSHCNMHCTFCPSDDLVRRKGNVSDDQARQLIRMASEVSPGVPIMFNVLGEPFLNKKLFEYVGLCEENKIPVVLITNITLLTEDRLQKLFTYGNVHLAMSLHTPTERAFASRGYKKIDNFRDYRRSQRVDATLAQGRIMRIQEAYFVRRIQFNQNKSPA
jgi:MoaA/NifB/PqqE/SkfB family radical SAM enzyme